MDWRQYISVNPAVMFGKAVIAGTRIPVDLLLEKLANGYTIAELLDAYPTLTEEEIRVCLLFADR